MLKAARFALSAEFIAAAATATAVTEPQADEQLGGAGAAVVKFAKIQEIKVLNYGLINDKMN